MNLDQEEFMDEEICVPESFFVISVAAKSHQGRNLKAVELAVPDQTATIKDLVKQYRRKLKIKEKTLGFGLEKIGRLNEDMSLGELLQKLQRKSLQGVQFQPLFGDFISLEASSDFSLHPQFLKNTHQDNQVKPCLSFPQFQRAFYHIFNKLEHLQGQLKAFVSRNLQPAKFDYALLNGQPIVGKTMMRSLKNNDLIEVFLLETSKVIIKFQSKLKIHLPNTSFFEMHATIKQSLEKLLASLEKEMTPVENIKQWQGTNKDCLVFDYQEYREWKVETLLIRRCGLTTLNCGLKIAGKILRPNDLLSTLDSQMKKAANTTIDALLIPESYFFMLSCENWQGSFKLDQAKSVTQEEIKRVDDTAKERSKKIQQQTKQNNLEWLRFIVAYTSTFFYKELNRYLRSTSHTTSTPSPDHWQTKFAYKLAASLLKLPNYCGTVFRGVDYTDSCKPGQIILYNSFLSTSIEVKRALKFCGDFGNGGTFYVIGSLSGRNIQKYSFYNEQEVLFPPCTYFFVLSVHQREDFRLVTMIQMPLPRLTRSNLLFFWLPPNVSGYNSDFNSCIKRLRQEAVSMSTQVIPFSSHEHLVRILPLIRSHPLQNSWVTGISNIGEDRKGIKNIRLLRQIYPSIKMCLFISALKYAEKVLDEQHLLKNDSLILATDRQLVVEFMRNRSLMKKEFEKNEEECQLI